jgi:hypothetical protein
MAQPTIGSFSPTTLPANGGALVITGTNFNTAAVTAVTLNGATVSFVVTNDTTLTIANTPPAVPGAATVAVTNPTGTATSSALTITDYNIPTRNNYATHTGVFDTSGTTRFTNNLSDQYKGQDSNLWSTATSSYPAYLNRVAKIKAVNLYNTRYNPDLPVVTF